MERSEAYMKRMAKELGRRGGLARARNTTLEQRQEWGRKGGKASAKARRRKRRKGLYDSPEYPRKPLDS